MAELECVEANVLGFIAGGFVYPTGGCLFVPEKSELSSDLLEVCVCVFI